MGETIAFGSRHIIDGRERVFYYGYWIKTYEAPADTLSAKKRLIEALTRRLFNHVEHGINIPGIRLAEARAAFESEQDPDLRRVKGAMLAGCLFNRATDIFTKLVELQAAGIEIQSDNALMRECGRCLQESLQLGKLVLHRSGEEGIDELWGEPFKAFSVPVEAFYESRYIKIGQAMRDIDQIGEALMQTFSVCPMFDELHTRVVRFTEAARIKCETLRTDPEIFDVWANFTVAGENLTKLTPRLPLLPDEATQRKAEHARRLLGRARELISDITRARVPMPKSTQTFVEECEKFRNEYSASVAGGIGKSVAPRKMAG